VSGTIDRLAADADRVLAAINTATSLAATGVGVSGRPVIDPRRDR